MACQPPSSLRRLQATPPLQTSLALTQTKKPVHGTVIMPVVAAVVGSITKDLYQVQETGSSFLTHVQLCVSSPF